ncbi:MAG: hypothetical protein ACPGVG_14825 [Mycobacterium sp.]
MASDIDIINAGLRKLGEQPIVTRTDQSPQARLAHGTYDEIRDALLRGTPWNFATKRESLSADSAAPSWGYERQFTLPSDCLRLVDVNNASDAEWRLESGKVLTDLGAPLQIVYVARVSENEMDVAFREALAAKCALEWAEALSQTSTVAQQMGSVFGLAIQHAKTADGQEDRQRKIEQNSFVTSRFI